jgi:hypothetical protein
MTEQAPLMVDVVPELAAEIEQELRASGDAELAEQVARLRMTRSCGCGDNFCASFYTGPYGERCLTCGFSGRVGTPAGRRNLVLPVARGLEPEVLSDLNLAKRLLVRIA